MIAKSKMTSTKSLVAVSPASKRVEKSMMNASILSADTIIDTPSQIDFGGSQAPIKQRFDCPIDLKTGLRQKKVKPVYKPETAPVYETVRDSNQSVVENYDDEKDDETSINKSVMKKSKRSEPSGDKKQGDAEETEKMSTVKVSLVMFSGILSTLIGLVCLGLSFALMYEPGSFP